MSRAVALECVCVCQVMRIRHVMWMSHVDESCDVDGSCDVISHVTLRHV